MFPFDPPENIRKPKVFSCFQGDQKGTLGSKGLKINKKAREQCSSQPAFTCSKLTIETLQQGVNFEHILTLCSSVSIVNFEHVIASWDGAKRS